MIDPRHFTENGVAIIPNATTEADLDRMSEAFIETQLVRHSRLSKVLMVWLSEHERLLRIAGQFLNTPARLVRILALDKTAEANWFVPWHQDRTIAVTAHADIEGFGNWTFKDGCHHAEPPAALLEQTVTLRVHLDDCSTDQGPLEVIPASHRSGRLEKSEIDRLVNSSQGKACLANRGDIVAMRPLIVHRSKKARSEARRRVLHLEFTRASLPEPVRWSI